MATSLQVRRHACLRPARPFLFMLAGWVGRPARLDEDEVLDPWQDPSYIGGMLPDDPPLTRKTHDNPHQEGWDVYYGDVRIGHIGTRAGVPKDVDQWEWSLGFYPGTEVGQGGHGAGASFEVCRAAFEAAWLDLKPQLELAAYELWRDDRDWNAWKYRMWGGNLLLPAQTRTDRSRCFCGADITSSDLMDHVRTKHRGMGAK